MFLVGGPAAVYCLLVARDALSPLCARGAGLAGGIEHAGSQEFGNELEFVAGQALHEAARLRLMRIIGTRNESGHQSSSHGRSPVGEKSYSYSAGIMSKSAASRKGLGRRVIVTLSREDRV